MHGPLHSIDAPQDEGRRSVALRVAAVAVSADAKSEELSRFLSLLIREGLSVVLVEVGPELELSLASRLEPLVPNMVVGHEGDALEAGRVLVSPAGFDVTLQGGCIRLHPRPTGRSSRVDTLFRSLAHDQEGAAIGVLLAGEDDDGLLGLRAIKEGGGFTFVQDPSTVARAYVLEQALRMGYADFCLAPGRMADELHGFLRRPGVPQREFLDAFTQQRILTCLAEQGVNFESYKVAVLEQRVRRRMALQGLEDPMRYVELLGTSKLEIEALAHDLLIGVTGFFRDQEPFELLKQVVFPRLLARQGTAKAPVRIWVPGCSTGEEPYSILMAWFEWLDEQQESCDVQLFASDVDPRALAVARAGHYSEAIADDVSSERLARFFARDESGGYRVSRRLRGSVVFAEHALDRHPPYGNMDLISCRNVLIYLKPSVQLAIFRAFHYALRPAGHLLLGPAESVAQAEELFASCPGCRKLYAKKGGAPAKVLSIEAKSDTAHAFSERGAPHRHEEAAALEETPAPTPRALRILLQERDRHRANLRAGARELHRMKQSLDSFRREVRALQGELASMNQELGARFALHDALERELSGLLDHVSSAVLLVGPELIVQRCSRAAVALLGDAVSPGHSLTNVGRALGAPQLEPLVRDVLLTGRATQLEAVRQLGSPLRLLARVSAKDVEHPELGAWIELQTSRISMPARGSRFRPDPDVSSPREEVSDGLRAIEP